MTSKDNSLSPPLNRSPWIDVLVTALLALAVYANTLGMQFASDDTNTILYNSLLHDLKHLPELFTSGMWPQGSAPEITYRPLFMASLALDYFAWGDNPLGYHLTSVAWHIIASILAYLLASKLLTSRHAGLAAGLLFAVHPVHSEAVAWISARSGIMVASFFFLALIIHLHARNHRNHHWLLVSTTVFFLATLCKETAITFPALVVVYELTRNDRSPRIVLLYSAPYILSSLLYLAIRTSVLGAFHSDPLPLASRLLTGPGVLVEYFRLLLFPYPLRVFYDRQVLTTPLDLGFILPLFILLVFAAGTLWSYKNSPRTFFGIMWVIIVLSPFYGILMFPRPALMAERYLYVPSFGFCLLAGIFFQQTTASLRVKATILGALIAILGTGTFVRNTVWQNDISFYTAYAQEAPHIPQAHNGLAVNYLQQGDYDKALSSFDKAIELEPNYFDAHYNLGVLYLYRSDLEAAQAQFRKTLSINPSFADAWHQLGLIQMRTGDYASALTSIRNALQINPNHPGYQNDYSAASQMLRRSRHAR